MCMFLLECVKWHCMCTQVGSSPCMNYSLLDIAHPVVGLHFRYKTGTGGRGSIEASIVKKAGLWLW